MPSHKRWPLGYENGPPSSAFQTPVSWGVVAKIPSRQGQASVKWAIFSEISAFSRIVGFADSASHSLRWPAAGTAKTTVIYFLTELGLPAAGRSCPMGVPRHRIPGRQTIQKGGRWSVRRDHADKEGTSCDREDAIRKAKLYIDNLLRRRERPHGRTAASNSGILHR
jgi:hypothetical protein